MTEQSDPAAGPSGPERADGERGPVGQLARLFLTQLLAVIAIAAVITAIVSWTGAGLDEDVTAAPGPGRATDRSPTSAATSGSSSATPSDTASSEPASPTSSAPATTSSSPEERLPKVDVLNQSAAGGSAAETARRLERKGWRTGRVDDFRGNVSETTVYYPPGLRSAARRLRTDLPGSLRLQEAFDTLSSKRLTVILVG